MVPKEDSSVWTSVEVLEKLNQSQSLKLLAIAETLAPKELPSAANNRNSAASEDSEQNGDTHPAALEADLSHYKELFGKLRFSYVEQVTKEKFLRSITENPPRLVDADENDEKEKEILALKASLKERKLEVAEILRQIEDKGKELSSRYECVKVYKQQLESLPIDIKDLEATAKALRQEQNPASSDPALALPLPATVDVLKERESELNKLNVQIASLQASSPSRAREVEKLEQELRSLETQAQVAIAAAKEARRRREEGGGIGDELEETGRWFRASEKALREMLEADN